MSPAKKQRLSLFAKFEANAKTQARIADTHGVGGWL